MLLFALFISGCGTALVVVSLCTPPPVGFFRIDADFEIHVMTAILNIGLPMALLSTTALVWIAVRSKAFHPFLATLIVVAIISVFACALAAWSGLVAMIGKGHNLWSEIWWG